MEDKSMYIHTEKHKVKKAKFSSEEIRIYIRGIIGIISFLLAMIGLLLLVQLPLLKYFLLGGRISLGIAIIGSRNESFRQLNA